MSHFLRRMMFLSPGDGGAAEDPAPPPADGGGSGDPKPVPYAVFKATNDKARKFEADAIKLKADLDGRQGWLSPEQVEAKVTEATSAEMAKWKNQVAFADGGVKPEYREYMETRVSNAKPEDVGTFLKSLQAQEPAFFGSTVDTQPEKKQPPATNPEGSGSKGKIPGGERPFDGKDIGSMGADAYAEVRKAHLARIAAARKSGRS